MKKNYLLLLVAFIGFISNAQVVTIPDNNFRARLMAASTSNSTAKDINGNAMAIDANSDGQIQLSEALAVYQLNVASTSFLASMTGIQRFSNLRELTCSSNNMLTSLDITNLTNLVTLNCSNAIINQLVLANVPALTTINCSYNKITNLDFTGATAATTIDCSHTNAVATLNVTGLNNLTTLDCSWNNMNTVSITNLATLQTLSCNNSRITSLTLSNLPVLSYLNCQVNSLTSLNLTNLPSILMINCSNNPVLLSVDFTNLPSLTNINCNGNYRLASFNFSSLPNLTGLDISDTSILTADLTNLTKLIAFYGYNNYNNFGELHSLDMSGLRNITTVNVSGTSITTLDLGAATQLSILNISYTGSLVSLNIKNHSSLLGSNFVHVLTQLKFICADESEIATITSSYDATFHPLINSYCNIPPGGVFNTVNGIVKFDYNGNGCDIADIPVEGVKFSSNNSSPYYFNTTYSDAAGNFSFYNFTSPLNLTASINNSYFAISPTSRSLTFNPIGGTQTANFCVTPVGVHNDLEISAYPVVRPRPGFTTTLAITYKNNGNTTLSGTLNLNFDDNYLNYVSSSLSTSSQTLNNIAWNFANLSPFESKVIMVTFLANTPTDATYPLNSGDILHYTATLVTGQTDETPGNNTTSLLSEVRNSFDPNDKIVLEGAQIDVTKTGDYLHYLVNFQNTGTASAINVVVKDIIAGNLDFSTLEMVASSHPCKPLLNTTNRKVEFFFEDINLPATAVNEPGSHGFIAFKIKPLSSVVVGNTMSNTANIYFDYNAPIITNTVNTTVVALGTQDFNFNSVFTLTPLPAKDVLNITIKESVKMSSASIYNILGQLVQVSTNPSEIIDVSGLKSGSYFIKIISNKGTASTKFLKE